MTRPTTRKKTLETKLRFGWTTGTCATAAVNAAYTAMVTGQFPDRVTIVTPSGKNADLAVAETARGDGSGGKDGRGKDGWGEMAGRSGSGPGSSRTPVMILT
jgi:hypothetical protein